MEQSAARRCCRAFVPGTGPPGGFAQEQPADLHVAAVAKVAAAEVVSERAVDVVRAGRAFLDARGDATAIRVVAAAPDLVGRRRGFGHGPAGLARPTHHWVACLAVGQQRLVARLLKHAPSGQTNSRPLMGLSNAM